MFHEWDSINRCGLPHRAITADWNGFTFNCDVRWHKTIDMHSFVVARESLFLHSLKRNYLFILFCQLRLLNYFIIALILICTNSIGMWRWCEILGPSSTPWCLLKSLRKKKKNKQINAKLQQRKTEFECAHSSERRVFVCGTICYLEIAHTTVGILISLNFIIFHFVFRTYFRIKLALELRASSSSGDRFVCVILDLCLVV